jgi:hypothetical protein
MAIPETSLRVFSSCSEKRIVAVAQVAFADNPRPAAPVTICANMMTRHSEHKNKDHVYSRISCSDRVSVFAAASRLWLIGLAT